MQTTSDCIMTLTPLLEDSGFPRIPTLWLQLWCFFFCCSFGQAGIVWLGIDCHVWWQAMLQYDRGHYSVKPKLENSSLSDKGLSNSAILNHINQLIRKGVAIIGVKLDSLESLMESQTLQKLRWSLQNTNRSLHQVLVQSLSVRTKRPGAPLPKIVRAPQNVLLSCTVKSHVHWQGSFFNFYVGSFISVHAAIICTMHILFLLSWLKRCYK